MAHHVVVGGGITGLTAAYNLNRACGNIPQQVTLIEADEKPGGKIRSRAFAGAIVDLGPEAFVAHVPEVKALCRALGLARIEGKLLTACTVCTSKWPHVRAFDTVIMRCSAGRWGDERALQLDDHALVEQIHAELVQATGVREHPYERIVTRWSQAIPQYETGHQAHVAEIEAALRAWPGLVLAGASYHGVGIASCIQDGTRAAVGISQQYQAC